MNKRKWCGWMLALCVSWLTACQPAAATPQVTSAVTIPPVEVTRPIFPTPTPLEENKPILDVSCRETGSVKRYRLDSALMNSDLYLSVYFPPCYDPGLTGGYPVLYLLHGQTFTDEMWLEMGANEIADELIGEGQSRPFLMVMPYEEFHYRSPENNSFPEALIQEIIPFVGSSFNVCSQKECRALGGISRGASWAVRLGLENPDLFTAIGAHSLPTFKGDLGYLPGWLDAIPEGEVPRIYMDIGRFDPEVKTATAFEAILNEEGVLHEWHLNDGRHNTDYWQAHIREYMQWYAAIWDTSE